LPNYDQNSEHESIIGVDTSNGTSGYIESQYVVNMEANTDCFEEMKMLRLKYPKKSYNRLHQCFSTGVNWRYYGVNF